MKRERARLDLERAMIEASLEVLETEKEAAAAVAEAEVLEAAASKSVTGSRSVSPQTVRKRTTEYVQYQTLFNTDPHDIVLHPLE